MGEIIFFVSMVIFFVSMVIFYGFIFRSHENYNYDQENWWDGGNSEEE